MATHQGWRRWFDFPNPVNDIAARLVATGVVLLSVSMLVTGEHWLLVPLAYGFWARVLTGPRLSPLGLLATRVLVPRLGLPDRPVPGPPKRFAQGVGVVFTSTAVVLHFGFGATSAADVVIGMLVVAASLEAFAGFCLGCWAFGQLMRVGVIPSSVCVECADIRRRVPAPRQSAA